MTLFLDLEWTPSLLGFFEDLHRSATGERGRQYAEAGRVSNLMVSSEGDLIRAAVTGSANRPYLTSIKIEGDQYLSSECSCAVGVDCKHGYAVALTVAGEAYHVGSDYQAELKRFLPPAWKNYAWRPPEELFESVRELFVKVTRSQPVAVAAAVAAASPQPQPPATASALPQPKSNPGPDAPHAASHHKPWWERLWTATTDQVRDRALNEAFESRFGSLRYFFPYEEITRLKALRNNAAILMSLEDALERFARAEHRPLKPPDPHYLELVRSEEVHRAYREFLEGVRQGHLREWMDKAAPKPAPAQAPGAALELNWLLAPTPWGIPILAYELLITTAKMNRRRRKPLAIRQLHSELNAGNRTTTPLMRELVAWLSSEFDATSRYDYHKPPWGDESLIPVFRVMPWIAAWGRRGVLRWDDATPVTFDPRPARIAIDRTAEGEALWVVEYPPPPGAPDEAPGELHPLAEAEVFSDDEREPNPEGFYTSVPQPVKSFYTRRGGTINPLDPCEMGPNALAAARAMRTAPVELMLERPRGARLLRRLVRGAGGGLVGVVDVRPVIELKARRGQWITLAAYGRDEQGHVFLRDPEGEWAVAPEGDDTRAWTRLSPFENHAASEAMAPLAEAGAADEPQGDLPASQAPPAEAPPAEAPPATPDAPQPQPDAPPAPPVIVARPETLAPVEHWLKTLIPPQAALQSLGQERVSYQWPANPDAEAMLLRAWQERPPGAIYLGNNDFLKMITPAQRPTLKISVGSAGVDWLRVSVEMEHELASLSAKELRLLLASSSDALLRLPDGRLYRREGLEEYERELAAIEDAGLTAGKKDQRLHAFHLAGEAGQKLIELGAGDERLAALATEVRKLVKAFKGVPEAPIAPETLEFLRPYQRRGADFLAWAGVTFGGALLADDMGLGKTLQVLAALTALHQSEKKHKPSLVICPASVAHNWQREARRFAPGLKTLVVERGPDRKKLWPTYGGYDIVIMNYALARHDADVIKKFAWLVVCVDEAQAIKNPRADIAAVVKTIPAQYRFALTGTPIENRISDLESIMEFAAPGFLPELGGADPATQTRRLRAWLRPVLLRRMKGEVAPELPDRIEERIDCAMTENQRKAYLAEVKRTRELLTKLPGKKVAGAGRIQILAALTRLRQLCCDPALVGLPDLGSCKTEELMNLLTPILESGNKVLLFSQFVRMLNRLHERLKKEKIPTYMLTGQTQHRQELVERFEHDTEPSVFLISLKAGGTGLNLVSASHVVLFDPWWNPAVEAQAIDRTHRIGQDKTVVAFRLVTEGTIEERILELQESKRGLVRDVLEEEEFNRTLTREDFEYLLG